MDQLMQCPVCTLYLHDGMSLESHLDTHPKDQVIRALCSLSVAKSNYSSRSSTPVSADLLYRGRSQTPASDENKPGWGSSTASIDHDRYWRRTPSRASSTTPSRAPSRNARSTPRLVTPTGVRVGELTVENVIKNLPSGPPVFSNSYSVKSGHPLSTATPSECERGFTQDQQDDVETKYSKSAEYNSTKNTMSSVFASHQLPPPYVNLPSLPTASKNDYVNIVNNRSDFIISKPDNLALMKTDMSSVQYVPGRQSMQVMLPTSQTYIRTPRNNIIMSSNICSTSQSVSSAVSTPLLSNQLDTFTPTKAVVTQQTIYREMVHSIDGKSFIPGIPTSQNNPLFPNLMVVNPYKNSSCLCTGHPSTSSNFKHTCIHKTNNESNKTLVIEIGPNLPDMLESPKPVPLVNDEEKEPIMEDISPILEDNNVTDKGLKILSNIKLEVPVEHDKSLLNKIIDLTGPTEHVTTNEPDFNDTASVKTENFSNNLSIPSTSNNTFVANTFSVIKNIGNPANKEPKCPDKISDVESTDSCHVPNLICNEKPSISPCSEISENGDNAVDASLSAKRQMNIQKEADELFEIFKNNKSLNDKSIWRQSNIYVKKQKKILKIKNSKFSPSKAKDVHLPSCSAISDDLQKTKLQEVEKKDKQLSITVRRLTREDPCRRNSFDTDNEAQSMDIEPVAHTSFSQTSSFPIINIAPVKELTNKSGFSCSNTSQMTPLESIRPMNIINYASMPETFDEESNHRELIELDAAAKSKQFANLMNDNYFGDNIYADYFTPDKVESFEAAKETANYNKDMQKGDTRGNSEYVWGEQPQKEYVLPNFNYNESALDDVEFGGGEGDVDGEVEVCEQDSKLDVLSESRSDCDVPLDICANENMPPRGELSGQESNGDMDAPWTRMYPEVPPPEPYDLMARESWISDSSDVDTNERNDPMSIDLPMVKPVLPYGCMHCEMRLSTLNDLHAHIAIAHSTMTKAPSVIRSRVTDKFRKQKAIKEEKCDIKMIPDPTPVSKLTVASRVLFDDLKDLKPNLEAIGDIIKKEPRKRPQRDYVCPTCKVDMLTYTNFKEHLQIHPLECLTCGKCFYNRHNLNLHMRMHLGIKNFHCDVCEKRFLTRQKLQEHQNVHTGRAPYRCPFCNDTFRRYSNMLQHRDRYHLNKKPKIRDFVCHCGEVFHSRAKLHWHKETHEEKPKACPYCSDKFIHTASLTRHIRRSHNACYIPQGKKFQYSMQNVPCPICKQVYLRGTLKAHLSTHTDKRPFVCVICNKAFTTKWNLKLHKWIHMNRSAKPFKCTLCKGAFIRQSEYISHMNAHKSVRPYTCNYCGCQFIRKYNCQRHVKEHEMAKKYVCKVPDCGKAFHRSYYLTEHMRVHSGARPFSCNVCGKTSSNKSNHNKHVKVHHSRDPIATEA